MMQYSIEGLPHEVWNELAGIDAPSAAEGAEKMKATIGRFNFISKQYAMAEARPEMLEPVEHWDR